MRLEALARAKVNLFLHVGVTTADGYHPLASLVTFADVGDRLVLDDDGPEGLEVTGPFSTALAAGENLIETAWRSLFEAAGRSPPPLHMGLEKRLPVAAGLGGGSADAAAAVRLLVQRYSLDIPRDRLADVCLKLGSDVPMCVHGEPCLVSGRGEVISPPPPFPDLPAVLVNPGVAVPTGSIFRRFDAMTPSGGDLSLTGPLGGEFLGWLAAQRNDLQAAAIAEAPVIGDVLSTLAAAPEARLARMSGSGATCFALCADRKSAGALAARLAAAQPDWWVVSTVLAGAV